MYPNNQRVPYLYHFPTVYSLYRGEQTVGKLVLTVALLINSNFPLNTIEKINAQSWHLRRVIDPVTVSRHSGLTSIVIYMN